MSKSNTKRPVPRAVTPACGCSKATEPLAPIGNGQAFTPQQSEIITELIHDSEVRILQKIAAALVELGKEL